MVKPREGEPIDVFVAGVEARNVLAMTVQHIVHRRCRRMPDEPDVAWVLGSDRLDDVPVGRDVADGIGVRRVPRTVELVADSEVDRAFDQGKELQ